MSSVNPDSDLMQKILAFRVQLAAIFVMTLKIYSLVADASKVSFLIALAHVRSVKLDVGFAQDQLTPVVSV